MPLERLLCATCGAFLLRYEPVPGTRIERRCPQCGVMTIARVPLPPPAAASGPRYEKRA